MKVKSTHIRAIVVVIFVVGFVLARWNSYWSDNKIAHKASQQTNAQIIGRDVSQANQNQVLANQNIIMEQQRRIIRDVEAK